ncbi:MAG: hypothetical protein LIP23_10675 [Planctomycetes bacterium]|nr:hypothetical protein [Planctomycetota bacterium]
MEIITVTEFLRASVLGRTLYTDELQYTLEKGALEGVYADQMTFSNLYESPTSLQYDLFVVSRERIYHCDTEGNRGELRKDFSGASLFRYHLAHRNSTGEITGYMQFISSSLLAVPAEAMASRVINLQCDGREMKWREEEIIYRDQPGKDGSFLPVSFEANCRLFSEAGKARYEYDGVYLDVDPQSHAKRPSSATYPKILSKEP